MLIAALESIPKQYLCGGPIMLISTLAFFCSSHDWYWETMNGHWRNWNTPLGRAYTKCVAFIGFLGGIGVVTGLITLT